MDTLPEMLAVLDRHDYVVRVIECNGGVIVKFPANYFQDVEDGEVTEVFDFRRGDNPGLIHCSEFDDDRFIALPEYAFCTVLTVILVRSCLDRDYPSDLIRFEKEGGSIAKSVAELIERPTGEDALEREQTFFQLIVRAMRAGFDEATEEEALTLDMFQGYQACKVVFLGDSSAS